MTLTLTSDLVLRIIVSGAYLIFFEVEIPKSVCIGIFGWRIVSFHFRITVALTSDLVLLVIVSRAYRLYCLR